MYHSNLSLNRDVTWYFHHNFNFFTIENSKKNDMSLNARWTMLFGISVRNNYNIHLHYCSSIWKPKLDKMLWCTCLLFHLQARYDFQEKLLLKIIYWAHAIFNFVLLAYISCFKICWLCHLVKKTKQHISIFEAKRQTHVRYSFSLAAIFFNLDKNVFPYSHWLFLCPFFLMLSYNLSCGATKLQACIFVCACWIS